MTSDWIRLLDVDDLPPGASRECVAGDRIVALYRVGDEFYALDGVCPHQGGPLGKGQLTGCVVTCPWHGWQFDVTTGKSQMIASIRQAAFAVKTENGGVYVNLSPAEG